MFIIEAFLALKAYTLYYSLELELPELKKRNRWLRAETTKRMADVMSQTPAHGEDSMTCKFDMIRIAVNNMSYGYGERPALFENVNISVPQGHMVAVIGD